MAAPQQADNDTGRATPLQRTAGIRPSDEWLAACQVHLQETGDGSSSSSDDAILHQVLHADLRDVVDRNSGIRGDALTLRRAIQESTVSTNADASRRQSFKVTLPSTFRLMVQVEEVLDVSVNAETRLSVGPASRTAPTPVGSQHSRCMKLCLSDGYPTTAQQEQGPQCMIAMEVPPLISDLSVHSHAGCKILLRGPLDVRLGILFLHAGCVTVLGGSVASLVKVQKQALEQAQRVAGVGVDPTVKALIWNPLTGMEEDQDEGEQESGDVVMPPPGPDHAPPPLPPVHSAMPPPASRGPSYAISTGAASMTSRTRTATTTRPPVAQHAGSSSSTATTTSRKATVPQHRILPLTAPLSHRTQVIPSSSSASSSISNNPYAPISDPERQRPVVSQTAAPSTRTTATTLETKSTVSSSQEMIDLRTPVNNAQSMLHDDNPFESHSSTSQPQPSEDGAALSLSFPELRKLMERIRMDRQLYRQYETKLFIVSCKMTGAHRHFNIQKKKNYTGKQKTDKYEYVLRVNLCDVASPHSTVTATISNDILLDCFPGPSPGEVRKMNKTDKNKRGPGTSTYIVAKGGANASKLFANPALWQLQLVDSSDEFFSDVPGEVDGDKSMLKILRKHGAT